RIPQPVLTELHALTCRNSRAGRRRRPPLKLTSQLLLVLNLVLAIVLMLHISGVAGHEIRKGLIADREEASVSAHLNHLTSANHALMAQEMERQRVLAEGRAEIRAKAAEHAQLLRWKGAVDASTADIQAR